MKKILLPTFLTLAAFFTTKVGYSQDVIVLKTGDEITAKVTEVEADQVKYKKWDNIDGPTYTTNKSDIFMIKYKNGSKDVFNNTANTATAPQQSNPDDAANGISENYLRTVISSNSNQILSLTKFTKLNGIHKDVFGQKLYDIEFAAQTVFTSDGWVGNDGLFGYFHTFIAVPNPPSSMYGNTSDNYGNKYVQYPRGQGVVFFGVVELENTDNGYRVAKYDITRGRTFVNTVSNTNPPAQSTNNSKSSTNNGMGSKTSQDVVTEPYVGHYNNDMPDGDYQLTGENLYYKAKGFEITAVEFSDINQKPLPDLKIKLGQTIFLKLKLRRIIEHTGGVTYNLQRYIEDTNGNVLAPSASFVRQLESEDTWFYIRFGVQGPPVNNDAKEAKLSFEVKDADSDAILQGFVKFIAVP